MTSRNDYVIHKVEFTPGDLLDLRIPHGSTVKHIAEQEDGIIQVWYERPVIDLGKMVVKLYCFATGQHVDVSNLRAAYFRTVVMRNGFVWHFYINYRHED